VTVGLIGILVGIAVPSYNGYRKNTVSMAIKADLGSGAKSYNAKYAVESIYCYDFSSVGLPLDRKSNTLYKKRAFYGFETIDAGCGAVTKDQVQYRSTGHGCVETTTASGAKKEVDATDNTACTALSNAGKTYAWVSIGGQEYVGTPGSCALAPNFFLIGATTNVSGVESFFTADGEGRIGETSFAAANNCTAL